jgi:acylphosphatase
MTQGPAGNAERLHFRFHVRIRGRVQGVAFRAYTQAEARRLGLTGWVRNEPQGSVEALAEGAPDALDAWLARCHHGPPMARVDAVDLLDRGKGTGEFVEFTIRP